MDLVNFSQDVYNNILIDYATVAQTLRLKNVTYIPISALNGDNIVEPSTHFSWYDGKPLLQILEEVPIYNDINLTDARFPVQYVIRPQTEALHDYRGYAGKIVSGIYRKGDAITIQPSGISSTISAIEVGGVEVAEAFAPQSAVLHLTDDVDVSRGDLITLTNNAPQVSNELDVLLCWMDSKPLQVGSKYQLQINSRLVRAVVKEVQYKVNVNSLLQEAAPEKVQLNDIIKATIKTAAPIPYDAYQHLRVNGGAILIDETSHVTVGACMIQ
jgi:sulfate adenylyltransferase subunit 1